MTSQPNQAAFANATPLDPIREFLGSISEAEYSARRHIFKARDYFAIKAQRTENRDALSLIWLGVEVANRWLYLPAPLEDLEKAGRFLSLCARLAEQAQELEPQP